MDKQGKFAQDSPDFVGGKKASRSIGLSLMEKRLGAKCREYTT